MRTWTMGDTTFIGNSDLSGTLTIRPGGGAEDIEVPAADVLALVARFIRETRITTLEQADGDHHDEIGRLEQMDDHALLGIDPEMLPA